MLNLASKRISPTATVQVLYYGEFFNYHNYFKRLMKIKPFDANACVALLYVNDYRHHYYLVVIIIIIIIVIIIIIFIYVMIQSF